jgi:hypothetical protein
MGVEAVTGALLPTPHVRFDRTLTLPLSGRLLCMGGLERTYCFSHLPMQSQLPCKISKFEFPYSDIAPLSRLSCLPIECKYAL